MPREINLLNHISSDDLSQVAMTATIDAAGNLGPVDGLWEKLGAARELAGRGLLRFVLVAANQDDPAGALKPVRSVGDPLTVLKARTLKDAIERLDQHLGPWGAG
jgi:PDZ domain-containing secreted protein